MGMYVPTILGKEIVRNTGLNDLFLDIQKDIDNIPLLEEANTLRGSNLKTKEQIVAENEAIRIARQFAAQWGITAQRTLEHGLAIEPGVDQWKYLVEDNEQSLLPGKSEKSFKPADDQDRIVVSGVMGVLIMNLYHERYPFLQEAGLSEYGFDDHMKKCAFVGAYILGESLKAFYRGVNGDIPSFTFKASEIETTISIGATMHGDFQITSSDAITRDAVNPKGLRVEYAPSRTVSIEGYHSIEPFIVASMIADVYMKKGVESANEFIKELEKNKFINQENGSINHTVGHFGDYGNNNISILSLSRLIQLLEGKSQRGKDNKLFSSTQGPLSSSLFEITSLENGIRFQSRPKNSEVPGASIDIPDECYAKLFETLLIQTIRGMGRTSPNELADVLIEAKKMLSGQSI